MKLTTQLVWGMTIIIGLSFSLFGACANELNMGGKKVTNMATPENANDATTKAYVDRGGAEVTPPSGYGIIYTKGKAWLDKNLGANRMAESLTDIEAYGDLYQWGRLADGHQDRNSSTTSSLSTTDVPGHANFILRSPGAHPNNWITINRTHFWSAPGSSANGVCPAGYRVPSEQDFADLDITNLQDAFNKIKLPAAGHRDYLTGNVVDEGTLARYWTSTPHIELARYLKINSFESYVNSDYRARGHSVRCLKHL